MVEVQKKKEIPKSVISVLCEFEASFLCYGGPVFLLCKRWTEGNAETSLFLWPYLKSMKEFLRK